MTKPYVHIEDYGNLENIIKIHDPAYKDIVARLDPQIANFAQGQLSLVIKNEMPMSIRKKKNGK